MGRSIHPSVIESKYLPPLTPFVLNHCWEIHLLLTWSLVKIKTDYGRIIGKFINLKNFNNGKQYTIIIIRLLKRLQFLMSPETPFFYFCICRWFGYPVGYKLGRTSWVSRKVDVSVSSRCRSLWRLVFLKVKGCKPNMCLLWNYSLCDCRDLTERIRLHRRPYKGLKESLIMEDHDGRPVVKLRLLTIK